MSNENKQHLLDLFTDVSERLNEFMYQEFACSTESVKHFEDEHKQRVEEFKKALDEDNS